MQKEERNPVRLQPQIQVLQFRSLLTSIKMQPLPL